MRDVHVTQFQLTLDCALEHGLSRPQLREHARLVDSFEALCARDYVPWQDFARLLNALPELAPEVRWADALSLKFLNLPLNRRLQALFRNASDPLMLYRAMNRFFGPYQFPCVTSSIASVEGRRLDFHLHIHPSEFVHSTLFLETSLRCMERTTQVFMGLPESVGELHDDGGAHPRFTITLPQSQSVLGRVKGALSTLWRGHDPIDVLDFQVAEVRKRLKELDNEEVSKQAIIDARVAELERLNAKLLEARRESDAKSHYLASLSHELRTPLNAIIGGTELVIEEMEDDGVDAYTADLERINHAGRHLLGLIEHVLDLSKIEAGRMMLSPERVVLTDFIDALLAPMELLARRAEVTLSRDVDTAHDTIEVDKLRLQQILTNLLGNALKFSSGKSVCLRVRDGVAGQIVFEVEDHGIGIAPDALETLFLPFKQADASIQKRFGGTGLGLTISREFALLMGGALSVRSELGEGTCFTLELPTTSPSLDEE